MIGLLGAGLDVLLGEQSTVFHFKCVISIEFVAGAEVLAYEIWKLAAAWIAPTLNSPLPIHPTAGASVLPLASEGEAVGGSLVR
jgi:hypothetical protein